LGKYSANPPPDRLVLVAAENDDEDDPEAALPRVYSYNVTTP
jgi:hypothetical protein